MVQKKHLSRLNRPKIIVISTATCARTRGSPTNPPRENHKAVQRHGGSDEEEHDGKKRLCHVNEEDLADELNEHARDILRE